MFLKDDDANACSTYIQPSVMQDSGLDKWGSQKCMLSGGNVAFASILNRPIHDVDRLRQRQDAIRHVARNWKNVSGVVKSLKHTHRDVVWVLQKPPALDQFPMSALYPSWVVARWLNTVPMFHTCYHAYRLWISPLMNLIYPLSVLLGPWWYLRRMLRWNMPFLTYIGMIRSVAWMLVKQSLVRMITFVAYMAIYLYGIFQSIDYTLLMHTLKRKLKRKLDAVCAFIEQSDALFRLVPREVWKCFDTSDDKSDDKCLTGLSRDMQGVYQLCSNKSLKSALAERLRRVYVIDAIAQCAQWMRRTRNRDRKYCFPKYTPDNATRVFDAGHPNLAVQVRNPVCLDKNLVVTGPNACGKTTYIRSILANIVLSQSFGIACAQACDHRVVEGLCSFMRVSDELGVESLFEAELSRCLSIQQTLEALNGKRVVVFMDEPMHATPPAEGQSAAFAFVKYIAESSDTLRCIVATHHAHITTLEKDDPSRFRNISMEAFVELATATETTATETTESNPYHIEFPYRIKKGSSSQSIALEMIANRAFPLPFIQDAIKIKNKLCRMNVITTDV